MSAAYLFGGAETREIDVGNSIMAHGRRALSYEAKKKYAKTSSGFMKWQASHLYLSIYNNQNIINIVVFVPCILKFFIVPINPAICWK